MKQARADLPARCREQTAFAFLLYERDWVCFGIFQLKNLLTGGIFRNRFADYAVRGKVLPHSFHVGCRKGNFGNEVVRCAARDLRETDTLAAVHGEAGSSGTYAV